MPNTWRQCAACNTRLRIYQDPHHKVPRPPGHRSNYLCDDPACVKVYVKKFQTPVKFLLHQKILRGLEPTGFPLCQFCKQDIYELYDDVWRDTGNSLKFCSTDCTMDWFNGKEMVEVGIIKLVVP